MKTEEIYTDEFETMGAGDPDKEELEEQIYGKKD